MKLLTSAVLLVGAPDKVLDIRYITGFSEMDPVIFLQCSKRKYLVVPRMESERARRETKGMIVRSMEDLTVSCRTKPTFEARLISLLRESGIKKVTVDRFFPIGTARKLEQSNIRVSVAKRALFPEREKKTAQEIRNIRESQTAALQAMRVAISMIARSCADRRGYLRQGRRILSAETVRTAISMELSKHDCIGEATIVACGVQAADPHCRGTGPLRCNEGIVIDIFPRSLVHGYWGDLTRTVVKGKASDGIKKMYMAVQAAQKAALACVKPGVKPATVLRAVEEVFVKRGFRNDNKDGKPQGFIHSAGHGVGLAIHEPPRIAHGQGRLKNGNVIAIEPGLYYRGIGGVRIEDVVEVTREGRRRLGAYERTLEV